MSEPPFCNSDSFVSEIRSPLLCFYVFDDAERDMVMESQFSVRNYFFLFFLKKFLIDFHDVMLRGSINLGSGFGVGKKE